jgi:putative acetyltransferase
MIRKYRAEDCETIIDTWFEASLVSTPFLSREFLTSERESIRNLWLHKAETWVFEQDGNAVGFLSLIGDEVGAIFVLPGMQGNGIGRALMDHAVTLRGDLYLDVFEDNAVGRRFYDKYGFEYEYKHFHEPSGHMQIRLSYKPGRHGPGRARSEH